MVRSACCSSRGPVFSPKPSQQAAHSTCDSCSPSGCLPLSSLGSCMHAMCIHHAGSHTYREINLSPHFPHAAGGCFCQRDGEMMQIADVYARKSLSPFLLFTDNWSTLVDLRATPRTWLFSLFTDKFWHASFVQTHLYLKSVFLV